MPEICTICWSAVYSETVLQQVRRRGGMADAIDLGSITVQVWRFESSRRHHDVAGSGARSLAGGRLLCKEKVVGSNPTGSTFDTDA